jgi:hypothetical protein
LPLACEGLFFVRVLPALCHDWPERRRRRGSRATFTRAAMPSWLGPQEDTDMHAAIRLSRTWRHWLMVGSLMLAAGLGLDAVWLHARVALAQWLNMRAQARSSRLRPRSAQRT